MSAIRQQLRDHGADLVFVGNGSPEQAGWFVEDFGIEAPVFSDQPLAAYHALEARRGLLSSINPRVFVRSIGAMLRGFRQTGTRGTATQQGGVWVLLPGNEVAFSHRSAFAGDHPSPEAVLQVATDLAQRHQPSGVAAAEA